MRKPLHPPLTQAHAALGYYMPAEWEPHAATWIAWPHYEPDWPGKFAPIPLVYAEIVRHLVTGEDVRIIAHDRRVQREAERILNYAAVPTARVSFHRWPTDRVWTRDSGPIFVKNAVKRGRSQPEPLAATVWRFNAWAKYSNWKRDAELAGRIAGELGVPVFRPSARNRPVVLEGGSIEVNGRGTLLTTEECLLSRVQQRNPGLKARDLEQVFAEALGIKKVIWLDTGIAGDDTHGHVDDIARFAGPRTVLAAVEHDRSDENYAPLKENLERLRCATDQNGRPLRVLELPMPAPVIYKGRRLPASYANFYIANSVVLVPTFNDANDRVALNLLARLFPARRVVGIYSGDFIWGFGAVHCMTQQQPSV